MNCVWCIAHGCFPALQQLKASWPALHDSAQRCLRLQVKKFPLALKQSSGCGLQGKTASSNKGVGPASKPSTRSSLTSSNSADSTAWHLPSPLETAGRSPLSSTSLQVGP